MADSKITALTSIGTSTDPAVDPLVLVDVSDTSMAATGTTKKVTLNNLLSSSPTATGNFTITGDLTVDTSTLKVDSANNRVGVGTASPGAGAALSTVGTTSVSASNYVSGSTWAAQFQAAANNQPSGVFLSGLTSGGLVVPGSLHVEPVAASSRSALIATYSADSSVGYFAINRFSPSGGTTTQHFKIDDTGVATWSNVGGVAGTALTLNANGLGLGVTPSAWGSNWKSASVGAVGAVTSTGGGNTATNFVQNAYNNNTNWIYQNTGVGSARYEMTGANAGSTHAWYLAAGGTAGNAITFTQAMTLDASGNLLVGKTANYGTGETSSLQLKGILVFASDNTGSASNRNWAVSSNLSAAGNIEWTVSSSNNGWPNFAYRMQLTSAGAAYNTTGTWGTISDLRLKENISDARNYLSDLLKLRVVKYSLKEEASAVATKIGFIAQEVEQVFPNLIEKSDKEYEGGEGIRTVKTTVLIPMLLKAIQELTARVIALENK